MNRRLFIRTGIATGIGAVAAFQLSTVALAEKASEAASNTLGRWKNLLSKAQYNILFEEGTEPSFTSALLNEKREGQFICAACYQPLFASSTKYESGTGWPSFWQPLDGAVETKRDFKLIFPRTEYHCSNCSGHQGHVFNDGPKPTGLRYCNNGLALEFIANDQALPKLRA